MTCDRRARGRISCACIFWLAAAMLLQCGPAVAPRPAGGAATAAGQSVLLRCLLLAGFSTGARGLDSSGLAIASQGSALASGTAIMGRNAMFEGFDQVLDWERPTEGFAGQFSQMPMMQDNVMSENPPHHEGSSEASVGITPGRVWAVDQVPNQFEAGLEYSRGRPLGRKHPDKCQFPDCGNFAG
jgi:hypothetical protein